MHGKQPTLSNIRKKFLAIFLPTWLTLTLVPLIVLCVLMAKNGEEKYETAMLIYTACTLFVGLLSLGLFTPWLNRKEMLPREIARFGYLFKVPKPVTEDEIKIQDEYSYWSFTFTKDGLTAEWEQNKEEGEQVFDEIKENQKFVPWKEAELALATQKTGGIVHIALAVLFDLSADHSQGDAFFIPVTEDVYRAICAFDLKDKLDSGWAYLFYNPQDAFYQILKKGRIVVMRNKKTGKIFVDKNGDFLGDEE